MGASKASQVCNFVHINRVKGYRVLENLKKVGFVSSTFSNPTVYSANDLRESLEGVISKKKFEAERLEKIMSGVAKNYEISPYKLKQTSSPQFTIISGRYNIYMRIAKMIKKETDELFLVTTPADLGMMYYTSIPELIQEAKKKGVILKFVTEMKGGEDLEMIKRMKIDNFRVASLPSKGRIVCGQSESLVSGYTTKSSGLNSEEDSALLTDADEFVRNMKCLAGQLWKAGKEPQPIKEKRKQIA